MVFSDLPSEFANHACLSHWGSAYLTHEISSLVVNEYAHWITSEVGGLLDEDVVKRDLALPSGVEI